MISWLIAHNREVGLLALGFIAGVVYAAWREARAQDARWEAELRSFVD